MSQKKKVGNYLLVGEIGSGQFGVVYKGVSTKNNDEVYAVKVIQKNKLKGNNTLQRLFQTEMKVMSMIKHPNIMHLYEFMETQNNYYLVIQFCNNGDLEKHLKKEGKLNEEEAVYFLMQLMNGFQELHKNKIMHRDVKLANLFLQDDQVVIGDFGFAKAGSSMTNTKLGTPITMAPELLNGKGANYSSKADLWSIGVCFYQMLFGKTPFDATSYKDLQEKVVKCSGDKLYFPKNVRISPECKDLLIKLIQENPDKRIEWNEFFNHKLFDLHCKKKEEDLPIQNSILVRNKEEDVNKKFLDNRKSAIKEVDLINPNNLKLENQVKANNYEEQSEDISKLKEIEKKELIQANIKLLKDRYYHEKKKIIFIMYTVRKIRNMAKKRNELNNVSNDLMLCSMLLLKKGLHLNFCTLNSLKNKINIFNLNNFPEFIELPEKEKIYKNLMEDDKIYQMFYQQMSKKFEMEINNKDVKNKLKKLPEIKSEGKELNYYEEIMLNEFKEIIKSLNNCNISSIEKDLINSLISFYYSINSEKNFPFKTGNGLFNWNHFEKKLEKIKTKNELINQIN